MTSQSVADDVTIARKLRLEYEKNISNSLDIDFIHGDIHGRSWRYVQPKMYGVDIRIKVMWLSWFIGTPITKCTVEAMYLIVLIDATIAYAAKHYIIVFMIIE